MVKYVVRLNAEEREQLLALVNTGRAAAAKLLHARILLKADIGADSRRWADAEIAEACSVSEGTVAATLAQAHEALRDALRSDSVEGARA